MKKKQNLSLTQDSIEKLFIKIAVPASIGTIFQTLYNLVDTYFAGKISSEALAAIAQTFPVYFIIIAMGVGISISTTSLIANSLGEKNENKASLYLAQSILIGIIVAIVVTIIGIQIAPFVISLMNTNDTTLSLSLQYLNIIFLGCIFFFIQITVNSSLTANGDTKSNRNVLIFSFFLNIILNPLFIFGYGFIPAMGIKGIALATITAQFIGMSYIIYKVYLTNLRKYLYLECFFPKLNLIKDLLLQGIPAATGMMMISIGIYIILFFISQYGDLALAGYGAAIRYEQIFLLPVLGLNTAVLAIAGQNFGSKNYARVEETYNKALMYGCGIMVVAGIIIYFSAESAVSFFTKDKQVIKNGTTYLKITALMEPIYPVFFISNALIQSLKKAIYVIFLSMFRMVILPATTLWFLIFYLESSFAFVFWGLLIINWIFGIFLFFFTKLFMKKEFSKIKLKEQIV